MADYIRSNVSTISGVNAELLKVQGAIASKVDEYGGGLTGDLNANGQRILNLPAPSSAGEPIRKAEGDALLATALDAAERAEDAAQRAEAAGGDGPLDADQVQFKRTALNSVTRNLLEIFNSNRINVLDFVPEPHRTAVLSGDYTSIASLEPISIAIDNAIAAAGNGAYPLSRKQIWFDRGAWIVNRPIKLAGSYNLDGDESRIIAGPAWAGYTATKAAGGTEVISAMIIMLDGLLNNLSGVYHWDSIIGSGLTLHGSDSAKSGVFVERQLYATLNCRVDYVTDHGFDIGEQCWGLKQDGPVVENWGLDAVHFRDRAAANGYTLVSPRFWGRFKLPRSGVNFADGSECNGVKVSGGFIEKMNYGVLVGNSSGPISIDGVDFEQCQLNVVRVAGDMAGGRRIGTVSVKNSFLHSIDSSKVYCSNARVVVKDCRLFGGSQDFETANNVNSSIEDINNSYETGTLNLGSSGANITSQRITGLGSESYNYLSHSSATFVTGYSVKNFQFKDAPFMQSSGLDFQSYYVGGGAGQYVSTSTWFITEYQHGTSPGTPAQTIGVRLANDAGQNSFQPVLDNATTSGAALARWSTVFAATGVINTSDERHKTALLPLDDREKAVAVELRACIRKFKFKDSVLQKGEKARIHFGVGAQTVKAIFEKHGLDGFDYAVLCYNEWSTSSADGVELREDLYGVRYDQLAMFILAAT